MRTTSLHGNTNDVNGVTMETLEADTAPFTTQPLARLFIPPRKTPVLEKLSPNNDKLSSNKLQLAGDELKGGYNGKDRLG